MEPLLLEDYKYGEMPRSIANILKFFERSKIVPERNDILVGFVYILMLETGFVPKGSTEIVHDSDFNYQRLLRYSKCLPEDWKRNSAYHLDFILESDSHVVCSLVCMSVSDDFIINCSVKNVASFSLLLDPLMYISSSKLQLKTFMFQNLDHLARTFKNSVAFPAKLDILHKNDFVCKCLEDLPCELLGEIVTYLKISDVMNMARTCKRVCATLTDTTLWIKLIDKDFRQKDIYKSRDELKFIFQLKYARDLGKLLCNEPGY